MSNIYKSYKPLRNLMRQCNLEASLVDVWQLSQYITNNGEAPRLLSMQPYSLKEYLYAWDIPMIAREIVLNATPDGKRRLNSWNDMCSVINTIREIENTASEERLAMAESMNEFRYLSHRQFSSQKNSDLKGLLRYLKVFGATEVEPIFLRATGFTALEYYLLGVLLTSHFLQKPVIDIGQDLTVLGISGDKSTKFFNRLTSTVEELKADMVKQAKYDETWEFTWNPLEAKPLICLDPKNRRHIYCPVPDFLLRRFSHGIYYDLCKAQGFDDAFGTSFENYIGDVLRTVFSDKAKFLVYEQEEYIAAHNERHHGIDWILMGLDANLFIECKTKRMLRAAKFSQIGSDLKDQIGIIADAVVQTYKNIMEAIDGTSKWLPNGRPSFPLVITLEDWFMFGSMSQNLLETCVSERMTAEGLDIGLLESMPYAVASAQEFEHLTGIVKDVGIKLFFSGKNSDKYRQWMWDEYSQKEFPNSMPTDMQVLFRKEWDRVFPTEAVQDETLLLKK